MKRQIALIAVLLMAATLACGRCGSLIIDYEPESRGPSPSTEVLAEAEAQAVSASAIIADLIFLGYLAVFLDHRSQRKAGGLPWINRPSGITLGTLGAVAVLATAAALFGYWLK